MGIVADILRGLKLRLRAYASSLPIGRVSRAHNQLFNMQLTNFNKEIPIQLDHRIPGCARKIGRPTRIDFDLLSTKQEDTPGAFELLQRSSS